MAFSPPADLIHVSRMLHLSKVRTFQCHHPHTLNLSEPSLYMSPDAVSTKGDFVWLDSGSGVPIGAEVKVTDAGKLHLIDDEGKVRSHQDDWFRSD